MTLPPINLKPAGIVACVLVGAAVVGGGAGLYTGLGETTSDGLTRMEARRSAQFALLGAVGGGLAGVGASFLKFAPFGPIAGGLVGIGAGAAAAGAFTLTRNAVD